MRNVLLSLVLIMLLAVPAMAGGKAAIYGVVLGENSPAPLAGVQITLIGEATYTSRVATTNEKGIYFFTDLPADEYILEAVAHPEGAFKPGSRNVFVGKDKEKEVNFKLTRR